MFWQSILSSWFVLCGTYPDNIMYCNGTASFLLSGYCASFDENERHLSTGLCLHTAEPSHSEHSNNHLLKNTTMCHLAFWVGLEHCVGVVCLGYYPLAYSTKCIMAAYLPLTLFSLVIMFFKINTTSSHLFALIYYCQTMSPPALIRGMLLGRYRGTN